jgi:hypothetical protein
MMNLELIQPQSWNDITFKQWKKLISVLNEDLDPLEKRLKQAAILNPHIENESDIGKLSLPQITEYFSTIQFLDNEPVKELFNEFLLDEKKFKQIQFKDISLAQWIDAEKFSLDVLDHHQLIAIFYIEPNEYDDIIRERVAEFIDEQPCSRIFYLVNQFFFIQTALERTTLLYSNQMKSKKQQIEKVIRISSRIDEFLRKKLGSIYYTQ